MNSTTDTQIFEQIKKSQKILVALPENLTTDSLASGLGLWLFLNKLKKDAILASSGTVADAQKFLPNVSAVQKQVKSSSSLVVTLDTASKKLEEISYQVSEAEDKVRIYLKSKAEEFTAADISFSTEKFPLDLIITLGAKSTEDLGKLYEQAADLFFQTPKINIDHQAENEYFGQINLVDVTSTSVAEILADLLVKYEDQLLDEDIATCLLTGIIEKTGSFQHVKTTPRSFIKASELISYGARQQEIIKHVYKTKDLSLLRLWGRALARIKMLEETKAIYSVLNASDFEKSEADEAQLLPTLKELIDNINGYKIVALLAEPQKNKTLMLLALHEQVRAEELLGSLDGQGKMLSDNFANYRVHQITIPDVSLESLENKFLEIIGKT